MKARGMGRLRQDPPSFSEFGDSQVVFIDIPSFSPWISFLRLFIIELGATVIHFDRLRSSNLWREIM